MPPKLPMGIRNILKAPAPLTGHARPLPPPPRPASPGPGGACTALAQHLSAPCRVQSLQLQHELDLAHLGASTDLNDGRARRRTWQQRLNGQIQQLTLQLLVSIFRYSQHSQGRPRPGPLTGPRWQRPPELRRLKSMAVKCFSRDYYI